MTDREDATVLARIEPMLAFHDAFPAGLEPGEWRGGRQPDGTLQFPWFSWGEALSAFTEACYVHDWVLTEDWAPWVEAANAAVEDVARVESASAEALAQYLTVYLREDRFVEGVLAGAAYSGALAAIVRRMAALAAGLRGR